MLPFHLGLDKYAPANTLDLPVLSGLILHLNAQDASTLTFGAGANITQWDDRSGLDNHVIQPSGGLQPFLASTAINGKPALQFSSDFLFVNHNATLDIDRVTTFVVTTPFSGGSTNATLVGKYFASDTPGQFYHAWNTSERPVNHYVDSVSGQESITYSSGPSGSGAPQILSYAYDENEAYVRVNLQPATTDPNTGVLASSSDALVIGDRSVFQFDPYRGQIAEVAVYDRKLSNAEINQVITHLSNSWGITV